MARSVIFPFPSYFLDPKIHFKFRIFKPILIKMQQLFETVLFFIEIMFIKCCIFLAITSASFVKKVYSITGIVL